MRYLIVPIMVIMILPFTYHPVEIENKFPPRVQKASWYDYDLIGNKGYVCKRNISDCYTETHRTGASRDYPRGSMVEVCRINSDRCVIVKITDFIEHPLRDIDLSSYAFSQLAPLSIGLLEVTITPIE